MTILRACVSANVFSISRRKRRNSGTSLVTEILKINSSSFGVGSTMVTRGLPPTDLSGAQPKPRSVKSSDKCPAFWRTTSTVWFT